MIPLYQRPIRLVNDCEALYDDQVLKDAILNYADRPVTQHKKVFMSARYPAVAIHYEKVHIHRLIWMSVYGEIPEGYFVHHINHNKLDARVGNLRLMLARDHQSYHNKGKKLTKEHRALLSESNRKRTGMVMKKRVDVDMQELYSLLESGCTLNTAAKHFGCDWTTIRNRIRQNPELLEPK